MKEYNEQKIREKYRQLTLTLIEKKLTVTTMESATSGQIASLITDTEGSSAILKGAFITYSNEAKIMQGVPQEVLEKFSVYSIETAIEMAKACRKSYRANIGIGVTGTMGNADPANFEDSVPGQVYFAVDFNGKAKGYYVEIPPQKTRLGYKLAVADEVADIVMNELSQS